MLLSTPLEAAKHILDLPFGVHGLVVYSNLNKCRKFYSYYVQEIIKKDTQLVEINPFYETEDSIRITLIRSNRRETVEVDKVEDKETILTIVNSLRKQHNKTIDVGKMENKDADRENTLIIFDSLKKYFVNSTFLPNHKHDQGLVNIAKSLGKEGATVICDMGVFNYHHNIQGLIDYEMSLPTHFDIEIKRICLYHYEDFRTLSRNVKECLINHHETSIRID